jgi:hypothetical protein
MTPSQTKTLTSATYSEQETIRSLTINTHNKNNYYARPEHKTGNTKTQTTTKTPMKDEGISINTTVEETIPTGAMKNPGKDTHSLTQITKP